MEASSWGLVHRAAWLAAAAALLAGTGAAVAAAPRKVTRAQAGSVAAQINLRRADLPNLTQIAAPTPTEVAQAHIDSARLAACYGGPAYSSVYADVGSPGFQTPGTTPLETVSSDTEIFPSAGLANADLTAANRPRGRGCVEAAYRAQLAAQLPPSQTVTVTIAPLPFSVAGGNDAFEARMTFAVVSRRTHAVALRLVTDTIGFAFGQAEVALAVTSTHGVPSSAQEHRLVATLVGRARAALG